MREELLNKIYFAKLRDGAVIPNKDDENGGYDIYSCFDEDYITIKPNQTVMMPTGICSAFDKKYVAILKERGSTGTKGMAQRAGVVDSGYRGEWFCPITNVNSKPIVISKDTITWSEEFKENNIIYPYSKAICQAVIQIVPEMNIIEVSAEEIKEIKSTRGTGALGSSGK